MMKPILLAFTTVLTFAGSLSHAQVTSQRLCDSLFQKDLVTAEKLIDQGVSLDTVCSGYRSAVTAFILVATASLEMNSQSLSEKMITLGAKPSTVSWHHGTWGRHSYERTNLEYLCFLRNKPLIEAFLRSGATVEDGQECMYQLWASTPDAKASLEITDLLVAKGWPIYYLDNQRSKFVLNFMLRSDLPTAIKVARIQMWDFKKDNLAIDYYLKDRVIWQSPAVAEELLKKIPDLQNINGQNQTALFFLTRYSEKGEASIEPTVKWLIGKGLSFNDLDSQSIYEIMDRCDANLLEIAARNGADFKPQVEMPFINRSWSCTNFEAIVQILVKGGADLGQTYHGMTPLCTAKTNLVAEPYYQEAWKKSIAALEAANAPLGVCSVR